MLKDVKCAWMRNTRKDFLVCTYNVCMYDASACRITYSPMINKAKTDVERI